MNREVNRMLNTPERQRKFQDWVDAVNLDGPAHEIYLLAVHPYLEIEESAVELDTWLRANVGNNADWNVEILADTTETAMELVGNLMRLSKAIGKAR